MPSGAAPGPRRSGRGGRGKGGGGGGGEDEDGELEMAADEVAEDIYKGEEDELRPTAPNEVSSV